MNHFKRPLGVVCNVAYRVNNKDFSFSTSYETFQDFVMHMRTLNNRTTHLRAIGTELGGFVVSFSNGKSERHALSPAPFIAA